MCTSEAVHHEAVGVLYSLARFDYDLHTLHKCRIRDAAFGERLRWFLKHIGQSNSAYVSCFATALPGL